MRNLYDELTAWSVGTVLCGEKNPYGRGVVHTGPSSEVKGVSWDFGEGKWRAQIREIGSGGGLVIKWHAFFDSMSDAEHAIMEEQQGESNRGERPQWHHMDFYNS